MLSYPDVIARLFASRRHLGPLSGLQNAQLLSERLFFPERSFPSVHIAGTNGKGSVSTKIAKALEYSGWKVGLYTSPHLISFEERIVVNGKKISKEEVVFGMEGIFSIVDRLGLSTTFFEMATLLGFIHFRNEKVDVAVIETGIGGRLDATNILLPLLAVITSISYDHRDVLGKTLEEIASEKAGILKPNIPLVLGPKARFKTIIERAVEMHCPIIQVRKLAGFYDVENTAIAQKALDILKEKFSLLEEGCKKGVQERPPCRFEQVGDVILDVAHNRDGFMRLFEALRWHHPKRGVRVFFGMSKDKELSACLRIAAKEAKHLYLVQTKSARTASTQELAEELKKMGYGAFTEFETVATGFPKALEKSKKEGDLLLVCGSFFLLGEVKTELSVKKA